MTVSVSVTTIDHYYFDADYDTLDEAWYVINHYLGDTWDHGNDYAVNAWGDVTVSIEGATWEEYKAMPKKETKGVDYDY